MSKKIIEGFATTYENSDGDKNIPIEHKRDIREDASWSYLGVPSSVYLEEQINDFRYEHTVIKKQQISDLSILHKIIGIPTNPITKALLTAEYQHEVSDAIKEYHGSKGILEQFVAPDYYSPPGGKATASTTTPLKDLTDNQLINLLFCNFKLFTKYGDKLEEHFKNNTGHDLIHNLDKWKDGKRTNKDALIESICKKVESAYRTGRFPVNVTKDIQKYWLDFTKAKFTMTGEAAAFGGVQEVGILGFLLSEKIGKLNSLDARGKTIYYPTTIKMELRFVIKDWFGADEEDIYKNEFAAQLDRKGLAALWILQHQRGYKPFINIITYKETVSFSFNNYTR